MDYYASKKRCDKCNNINDKNSNFCNKCGSDELTIVKIKTTNKLNKNVGEIFTKKYQMENKGSFAAGFCLVLFLHLIGIIIALAINKEDTKKGAYTCLLIYVVFILIVMIIDVITSRLS